MDGHCQFNKRFNHTYDIFCCVFHHSHYIRFYYFIYGYMGLFDIYSKEHRGTIMAKETMKEMIKMIDAKINHIEDVTADNRDLLIKLIKQNNSIVNYLKQLEIDIVEEYDDLTKPPMSEDEIERMRKVDDIKEVLNEFIDKRKDLVEFEKELKKHKDKLTPGQVGDA